MDDFEEDERTLQESVKELAAVPVRIVTSPTSQKLVLRAVLLLITAVSLTGFSIAAYLAFYYRYIPALGVNVPVYLQFHPSTHHPSYPQASGYHHPYGVVPLPRGTLVSNQAYNIKVQACLPRIQQNVEAGNFMIDVELLGPAGSYFPPVNSSETRNAPLLAKEARPAILTHTSAIVEWANAIMMAPLHVLGFARDQQCLEVPVMEGVSFDRGWRNQPESARVEVRSAVGLRIYAVSLDISTRFTGLRWLMYNHRIFSFAVFTTGFWSVAMGSALLVWLLAARYMESLSRSASKQVHRNIMLDASDVETVKAEGGDTSDARVKREPGDETTTTTAPSAQEQVGAEADDEDEEDDFVLSEPGMQASVIGQGTRSWRDDSGVGTSLDSAGSSSGGARARRREIKQEEL